MAKYRQHYSTRQTETPQTEAIPNSNQVKNSAGGYSFAVDDWVRLERFLVLGTDGGSYYANERELSINNAEAVKRCIAADGLRVVETIINISNEGRAPKNDPALYALAMAAGLGNDETRKAALSALPKVARTGTHLFHFTEYIEGFRGWGSGLKKAVSKWYNEMPLEKLALQVIKYQQRDGWSHRDLIRLAHPKTVDVSRNSLYNWVVNPDDPERVKLLTDNDIFSQVKATEDLKSITDPKIAAAIISSYNLPREAVPTNLLNNPEVWEALLVSMPMIAMVRNLAKMTNIGLLTPMSPSTQIVVDRLSNDEYIKKSKIHPIQILSALTTYQNGKGVKGKLTWKPVPRIIDALNKAFYISFGNVESTGKRTMLALDVSASMGWGNIAGVPGLTPRDASAAMALVTANVETQYEIMAFTEKFRPLNISPGQRLSDVIKAIGNLPFGGTDCSLPMTYALKNKIPVDTFIIYTDSETWAGRTHPVEALKKYRKEMGIPAKLVVVGMVTNGFSIADPNDAGMLDVIGFSTATPQLISDFAKQ